ncbi:MAG TPA: hypothetical protein VFJ90_02440 [Candidatus Didemnitutus sp.]|nr:hypothetical protein [Candidatus Didemnitutus sp.]
MSVPVTGYMLQVSMAPLSLQGTPPPPFVAKVFVQTAAGGIYWQMPINGPDEFTAVCALLQSPGRLLWENDQLTLQKIMP